MTPPARKQQVHGSLKRWEKGAFVPVRSGQKVYYGGWQQWLSDADVSQTFTRRACGTVAAANALAYMAHGAAGEASNAAGRDAGDAAGRDASNAGNAAGRGVSNTAGRDVNSGPPDSDAGAVSQKAALASLYTAPDLSKASFTQYIKQLYTYVHPRLWGVPTAGALIRGVRRFAREHGVQLTAHKIRVSAGNAQAARDFAAAALAADRPVLLLTWNSSNPDQHLHWLTITRLYLDPQTGHDIMVTSNWAEQREYDFTEWSKTFSWHKALLWFEAQ